MTTHSAAKPVLCFYYLELYPYPLEPDISRLATELIYNFASNIFNHNDCALHHICITKRKVGIYFQAPPYVSLQRLIKELIETNSEFLPKWDKHFSLYTVGLPYRLFKRATTQFQNKFSYIE